MIFSSRGVRGIDEEIRPRPAAVRQRASGSRRGASWKAREMPRRLDAMGWIFRVSASLREARGAGLRPEGARRIHRAANVEERSPAGLRAGDRRKAAPLARSGHAFSPPLDQPSSPRRARPVQMLSGFPERGLTDHIFFFIWLLGFAWMSKLPQGVENPLAELAGCLRCGVRRAWLGGLSVDLGGPAPPR